MNATDTTTLDPRQQVSQRGPTTWEWIKSLLISNEFIMLMVVFGLLAFGQAKNPNVLDQDNLKIMTRDIAILGIASIGVGFTIITAGIDLSVGSMEGTARAGLAYCPQSLRDPQVSHGRGGHVEEPGGRIPHY